MIGIYTNLQKDINLQVTNELIAKMKASGLVFSCYNDLYKKVECDKFFDENSVDGFDLIIALGGDGTVLNASAKFAKYNIPICGINLGKVGFLAEIDATELDHIIDAIKSNNYGIIERSMLEYSFDEESGTALNDVTFTRSNAHSILNFEVIVGNETISKACSDGILISTPTGSTAYSLSAGGPIVSYDVNCFIITPLNAHSLFSRSMIFNDNECITINADKCASITADGICISDNVSKVVIKKAMQTVKFVVFDSSKFYSKLRKKLGSISILPEDV